MRRNETTALLRLKINFKKTGCSSETVLYTPVKILPIFIRFSVCLYWLKTIFMLNTDPCITGLSRMCKVSLKRTFLRCICSETSWLWLEEEISRKIWLTKKGSNSALWSMSNTQCRQSKWKRIATCLCYWFHFLLYVGRWTSLAMKHESWQEKKL